MKNIVITQKNTIFDSEAFKLYLQEISKLPILTPLEETKYAERAIKGDKKAEDLLIMCNLRFVISVAKIYVEESCRLEDLVNEGNEGLIIAARRFNPNRGYKFISYAVWWIRRSIIEYKANYGRFIRIPNNKLIAANKVKEEKNKFEVKFNREPTSDELQDLFAGSMTEEKLRNIYDINQSSVKSLDYAIDADGTTFKEILPDENAKPSDHLLISVDNDSQILTMLNVLTPTQRQIIIFSYGLDGNPPMTLHEIGNELGVSRERVRQLKDDSLVILKFRAKQKHFLRFYRDKM